MDNLIGKNTDTRQETLFSELIEKLKSYNIPLKQWGTGEAKKINHLAKEVAEGESTLIDKDGEIIRSVGLVHIDVLYKAGDLNLQLIEDRQEFKGGRIRRRELTGISEKLKPGENPLTSAKRSLTEELGIDEECLVEDLGINEKIQVSPSYPGLKTLYTKHEMLTYLPRSAFRIDGYTEVQPDKNTFFIWKKIE